MDLLIIIILPYSYNYKYQNFSVDVAFIEEYLGHMKITVELNK